LDGNGRLSFCEFCIALRKLSFHGNVKSLWHALDIDDDGLISLAEIDSDADQALTAFRDALLQRFSSLLEAWHKGIDRRNIIRLGEAEFVENCEAVGIDIGGQQQLKNVFRWLLPNIKQGHRQVHIDDLAVLLASVPTSDRAIVWHGSPKPVTLPQKPEFDKEEMILLVKNLLIRHYGSIYAGWCKGLDKAQNGHVPMGEFIACVSAIGFTGNVRNLFKAFDKDNDGHIVLKEVDSEVAEAVETLLHLIDAKYESVARAWNEGFDKNGNRRCDEPEFVDECAALGYTGDAAKLFTFLRPEKGRPFILLEDLRPGGLAAARNNSRQDSETRSSMPRAASPSNSPTKSPPGAPRTGQADEGDEEGFE